MPHIDVNGQSIHYTDSGGDGPPMVLSHPMFLDTIHLEPLADALAGEGYRVVTFDQRGHGATRFDGKPFEFVEVARDALELAAALGIERAVFGGELYSAAMALHAALLEPERVAGLVLVGATARATDLGESISLGSGVDVWTSGGPQSDEFGRVAEAAAGPDSEALMDRWRKADWSQIRLVADAWLGRPSIEDRLSGITCPAVVIHGRNEFYIPLEHGEYVTENLGGPVLFEIIEGQHQALSITRFPETLAAVRSLSRQQFPV
ncbi:O-methylpimelyl-ACP methylesterase [Mycobacteroides stephanolepidis]|uniref:O-methylpimelyl-ACP methylesterase n=1 Tax=[Mycobacterium] stephanolepidis TaxID=1520670 RepID=A0A1Z4F135_9MYCO|nr:alpha/beta hydrolase [[Mycobacterium] stephanolepidis]BAX98908.1 O-methylpimelyl-ACP methylesterase [[Mycobacterium] stephanolepidis]